MALRKPRKGGSESRLAINVLEVMLDCLKILFVPVEQFLIPSSDSGRVGDKKTYSPLYNDHTRPECLSICSMFGISKSTKFA